jgi:hypothetical protein
MYAGFYIILAKKETRMKQLAYSSTLKTEATFSCEASVDFQRTTQRYTRESYHIGHKWIQNVKHVIFEPGRSNYFSTYPPSTLIHLSHRFTSSSKPAA